MSRMERRSYLRISDFKSPLLDSRQSPHMIAVHFFFANALLQTKEYAMHSLLCIIYHLLHCSLLIVYELPASISHLAF